MLAGAEATQLGYGGVSLVSRACGLSRVTIMKGIQELDAPSLAPERIRLFKFEFKPPRPGLVAVQVLFGCTDVMAGAGVFWLLLGAGAPHYSDFLSAYIISIVAGLLSGVPGGAGVFETAMLQLLPMVDRTVLAAAFLGFRLIYYFAPLTVALLLLAFMKHAHDPDTEPGPVQP